VIGAGPVGLTLANELARRAVRTRIIDKLPSIREVSKALIWHVRTQEALDKVGIMERGVSEAAPLREVVVQAYGKHIGSWKLDGIDSAYPHPLIIGQNRTQHLLEDLLISRNAKVEWNTEAIRMSTRADSVTLTLRHSDPVTGEVQDEVVQANYVVGCEGSKSLVRQSMNLTFEGERYSGEQFIQADCKLSWGLPSGRSYLFLTTDGYMMAIELPDGRVRIFISLPDSPGITQPAEGRQEAEGNPGAAEDVSHEPSLAEVHEHFERLSGLNVRLADPVWLARYRTSHRYANKFREGRAFVAGDAGHVHVPIGGQGMNTGIQDAFNLGWKLAGVIRGAYREEILDTYNQERHPVAKSLIKGTDFAYQGILHPSELKQQAVRLFGPFIMRTETAQNFMRNTLEEMTISYPDTPLCLELGGGSGPKAGERALDAPMVRSSDKRTLTLNELFRDAEWTLLLFTGTHGQANPLPLRELASQVNQRHGAMIRSQVISCEQIDSAAEIPGGSTLLDLVHYGHAKYGVTHPAIYLVRPDSYIGFRGPLATAPALFAYLAKVFTK